MSSRVHSCLLLLLLLSLAFAPASEAYHDEGAAGLRQSLLAFDRLGRFDCQGGLRCLLLESYHDSIVGLHLQTTERSVNPRTLQPQPLDLHQRDIGAEWPMVALTMVGSLRLSHVAYVLARVIEDRVPGDFIECGAWRGGASLMASLSLRLLEESHLRQVHVADSFEGLPEKRYADSPGWDGWHRLDYLRVSRQEVERNYQAFGIDVVGQSPSQHGVHFHEGYFVDSLPRARQPGGALSDQEARPLAVIRLDGDMYDSVMDVLFHLYDRLSIGGWVVLDDYPDVGETQQAVDDFRAWHDIEEPITCACQTKTCCEARAGYVWQKQREIEGGVDWDLYQ